MKLHKYCNALLPALSWSVLMRKGESAAHLVHGAGVEVGDGWFVEGGWDGSFDKRRFLEAPFFLGSGGRVESSSLLLGTPTHTLERLQSHRQSDQLVISNSLAFLLAHSQEDLLFDYPFYDVALRSFVKGIRRGAKSIRSTKGQVQLHYCCNLRIAPTLEIETLSKPLPDDSFGNFQEYVDFAKNTISRIHQNTTSAARQSKYQPLSTISTGYDSPACTILSRHIGCDEAITFSHARENLGGFKDSGEEIADYLNVKVHHYNRDGYLSTMGMPEADFLAVGTGGEDAIFAPLDSILPGRLFVTGFLGDTVWGLGVPPKTKPPEYIMSFPAGSSLTEFRLRVGFIHMPIPQMMHAIRDAVYRVSISQEMEPWRIKTDDDRPIPRRLIEEQGVPREMFGMVKKAITQPYYHNEPLRGILSESSYQDFKKFVKEVSVLHSTYHRNYWRVMHKLYRINQKFSNKMNKVFGTPQFQLVSQNYSQPVTENAYLFLWGLQHVKERYAAALMESTRKSEPQRLGVSV